MFGGFATNMIGIGRVSISFRGVSTGNASVGGSCHRIRHEYESSFQIDDYYRDTAFPVVNKDSCQNISPRTQTQAESSAFLPLSTKAST